MIERNLLKNNKGYSLIEMITVIAILSIMVGGMTFGVSLVFSKDAFKCATAINDAVYDARAISMTKPGDYKLKVSKATGEFMAEIVQGDASSETVVQTIRLDEKDTIDSIEVNLDSDSTTYNVDSSDIYIGFDKSKGNADTYGTDFAGGKIGDSAPGGSATYSDGVIVFTVKQKRGNKPPETVSIVTSTGKHFVGDR